PGSFFSCALSHIVACSSTRAIVGSIAGLTSDWRSTMFLTALVTTLIVAAPPARAHAKPAGPEGGIAGVTCACDGDIDSSGGVDAADLSLLLGQWGVSGTGDLNGDDVVDAADLSILLGAWGPCASAPANDLCSNAQVIDAGLHYFCTNGASTDGPNPGP